MLSFAKRRLINLTFTGVLIAAACYWVYRRSTELHASSFQTGYILIGIVVFLMSYNWRKKLPAIPLGSSAMWLQFHIYTGIVSMAIFLLHTGFRIPNGVLETTLYLLFVTVAGSGVYGLQLTRSVPKKITKLREQVTWERIPSLRIAVQRQAHGTVVGLLEQSAAVTISDFYKKRLLGYFHLHRSLWYYSYPTSQLRDQILSEMTDLQRYYSPIETAIDQQLRRLVDQRDDLDYQDALQRKLKIWLFAHIGLSHCLVVLALFHTVMAHAFRGGLR